MKNRMSDLRNHLFETIEMLKDPAKPLDLARARAISDVAQTLIDTAKVEIEFADVLGVDILPPFFDSPILEGRPRAQFALPSEVRKSA